MQFNEIYEKTKYAFEHDEVFELLMGQKGYEYQAPMVPASVPTHDEYIFEKGIYPYYKAATDVEKTEIYSKIKNALRCMINSENEVVVWWALSLLYGQKLSEDKYKDSPFSISAELLNEIKPSLMKQKEKLQKSKQYEGGCYSEGLWGDVLRYNTLLLRDFNFVLLG